jgi:hypothetical protein
MLFVVLFVFWCDKCWYCSPHDACYMCNISCHTTYMIIILLNFSLCSWTVAVHVQKTGDTAPSPCHLHQFWYSLDIVVLEVSIAVLYDTSYGAVCCRPFLVNTEWVAINVCLTYFTLKVLNRNTHISVSTTRTVNSIWWCNRVCISALTTKN